MFLLHAQLVDQNNVHVFPSGRTDLSINSMETSICTLRVKKTSLFVQLSTSVGDAIVWRDLLFSHLFFFFFYIDFITCQQKLSMHPNL